MKRIQVSTGDNDANSAPDSSGSKKYRSHKEEAIENSANKKINYFDRLPDELLAKIFKYAFGYYKRSVFRYYKPENDKYYAYRTLLSLSSTCRRFCHILNYSVLADINLAALAWYYFGDRVPRYDFNVTNEPPSRCDFTGEDVCQCRADRKLLESCKLKYRYLTLCEVDLSKKCIPKLIQDNLTNLDWVVQLSLEFCVLDFIAIDKILTCLPRVERLSILLPSKHGALKLLESYDRKLVHKYPPVRTLYYLQFIFCNYFDQLVDDQLLRLPAKIVDGAFRATESNLGFVREYLLQHKGIVENFRFRLRAPQDSQVELEYFEGFSITTGRCDDGGFEITSLPPTHLDLDKMFIEPSEGRPESEDESDSSDDDGGCDDNEDKAQRKNVLIRLAQP